MTKKFIWVSILFTAVLLLLGQACTKNSYPDSLRLEGIQVTKEGESPDLGGKAFEVKLHFNYQTGDKGPLFTFYTSEYGMFLFIWDNKLYLDIRTKGEEGVLEIPDVLSSGKLAFKLHLDQSGTLSFFLFDGFITSLQTTWPLPTQTGEKGIWSTARSAFPWIKPKGNFAIPEEFSGEEESLYLELNILGSD